MDRDKFVGVIVSFTLEGKQPVDHILVEFVGEGNESIVFGIAPLDDPQSRKWVMKFLKPEPMFEMTVPHYSIRIAEKLYPNHPFLMPPEERMRRLTDEMLGRIESEGSLFGLSAFQDMLFSTIVMFANQFFERFQAGSLPASWMNEIDKAFLPMLDENLVVKIESMLDDEAFIEEAQPFYEQITEEIQDWIAAAKKEAVFSPFSRNRLFKLLGLHLEDFINWEELLAITDSEQFRPALAGVEVTRFSQIVSTLYFRTLSHKDKLKKTPKGELDQAHAEYDDLYEGSIAAARYLDAVSVKYHAQLPHLTAFAKNWHARTLLLEGKSAEAQALYEEVLKLPITDESILERHDAFLDLSELLARSNRKRSKEYAREAAQIRQRLGIE